jgi:hypothetical protein
MALLGLIYRDSLFPRPAYARAFEAMRAALPDRMACRLTLEMLALAHERACEAELAKLLEADLDAGRLPDMASLRARFVTDATALPIVTIHHPPLSAYEGLAVANRGDAA